MVDRLRSAAEQLEAPICPDCHVEMKWFRSELLADEPTPIIAHLFVCPHCKRAAKTETIFRSTSGPAEKLSAPRFIADAALRRHRINQNSSRIAGRSRRLAPVVGGARLTCQPWRSNPQA
ncbi:hypothetical protein [Bradyrhizobium sp. WSM1743]|uniref:hypothetical protein n=1 Tax=Bradyrhizobium sp. WSM1743 TaxID=318996 RepID=UPI00042A6D44|nr:hypothetical protein [Bradyrhizobium sp. WSM1743]